MGRKVILNFENEGFVDKTKALTNVIKKKLLPSFELKSKESTKSKPSKENLKAKLQEISVQGILQFDLVPSVLFEGDFTAKPEKHFSTTELEKLLSSGEYNFPKASESETSIVLDFMSLMRRINLTNLQIFKDGFEALGKFILSVCVFNQFNIVYHSYIIESIIYDERQRRVFSTEPLMFVNLQQKCFIAVLIEKFWANDSNKENLQEIS